MISIEVARENRVLALLPEDELHALLPHLERRRVPTGAVLEPRGSTGLARALSASRGY
jgi:hypothetical protein